MPTRIKQIKKYLNRQPKDLYGHTKVNLKEFFNLLNALGFKDATKHEGNQR